MNLNNFTPKQTQIETLIREKLPKILVLGQQDEIDQIIDYSNSLEQEKKPYFYRYGLRDRGYTTLFGKVNIRKQRFRNYPFHPFQMFPYERRTAEFNDCIEYLYQSGILLARLKNLVN